MDAYKPPLPSDRFDATTIPVVPPAVGYLLSTLYAADSSIKSLAIEVERFPSIAARLLAVANSAWSAPSRAVTDLSEACTRLGLDLVRTLSIALAVANTFDPTKCPGFDGERYWVTALLAAEGTSRLGAAIGQRQSAAAWRCGALFHNIGLLWLADSRPAETNAALLSRASEGLASRLQHALGTDFCEAGGELARLWGLPDIHVDIIAHHRDPDAAGEDFLAAATVGVAADMASRLYSSEPWTPGCMSANIEAHIPAQAAESTWHALAGSLEPTREMGRMIATA